MKRKIMLLLLSLMFLSMAGYSGYKLLMEYQEYKAGEETYNSLSQYIQLGESPSLVIEQTGLPGTVPDAKELMANTLPTEEQRTDTLPTEEQRTDTLPTQEQRTDTLPTQERKTESIIWPTVDFASLQAINPDVVAWIYLEGTVINYPVVQGSDNSEYLYRLVDGTANSAGSIFMDYRNQSDFTGRNTVLYGHHMKNKTMFAPIANYKEQSFYDEHPTCLILTPQGNYTLEFFAGLVVNLSSNVWKMEFESDNEYEAWLEQAVSSSTFQSNICPTPRDRVVTLTTCSYEFDDARYVLLGILTSQS